MSLDLHAVFSIVRKEIREGLRDRSLVIGVILIPLFLYPLLGLGVFQVLQIISGISEERNTRIVTLGDIPVFVQQRLLDRERFELVDLPEELRSWARQPPDSATYRRFRDAASEPEELPDALLVWRTGTDGSPDTAIAYVDRSRDRSVLAFDAIEEDIRAWRADRTLDAFVERGLAESDVELWELEEVNTASASERGQELLSIILPLILLYMLATGAYYAALDTVVGERERGTFETLLTSPLSRVQIIVGKYLFVVTASLTSLLLNLFGIVVFVAFVLQFVDSEGALRVDLPAAAVGLIFVTGLLLAALLAAVMMVLLLPTRTYREGQAILSPVLTGIIVPGIITVFSRGSFTMKSAFIPVLNAVELFKSVVRGEYPAGPIVVTLLVLGSATVLAVKFAASKAANEAILFDPRITLRELFTGKKGASS